MTHCQDLWLSQTLHRCEEHEPAAEAEGAGQGLECSRHPAPLCPTQGLLCLRGALPLQHAQPSHHHIRPSTDAAAQLGKECFFKKKKKESKRESGCFFKKIFFPAVLSVRKSIFIYA